MGSLAHSAAHRERGIVVRKGREFNAQTVVSVKSANQAYSWVLALCCRVRLQEHRRAHSTSLSWLSIQWDLGSIERQISECVWRYFLGGLTEKWPPVSQSGQHLPAGSLDRKTAEGKLWLFIEWMNVCLPSGDCNLLCSCCHCCHQPFLTSKPSLCSLSLWTKSSQASITTPEAKNWELILASGVHMGGGRRGAIVILLNSYRRSWSGASPLYGFYHPLCPLETPTNILVILALADAGRLEGQGQPSLYSKFSGVEASIRPCLKMTEWMTEWIDK